MKKQLLLFAALSLGLVSNAQLTGGHAYLIGQYVEIGINAAGHEGAPDLAGSHSRGGASTDVYFGFISDPNETGWVDYNGDFFTPGSPENGFGVKVEDSTYHVNGMLTTGAGNTMIGAITDYSETIDSVTVTWVGNAGDLELTVNYILRKDEHFYTTELTFANTGTTALTDVYYYRNLDPDNNQTIGGTFTTVNTIVCQGTCPDSTAIVTATQSSPFDSEVTFDAEGSNWRAVHGGFSNRDAVEIWDGTGTGFSSALGATTTADQAIAIAYKIPSLPTGKMTPHTTSFETKFKPGPGSQLSVEENVSPLSVYPTATSATFQINLEGSFNYFLIDVNGKILKEGYANDVETVDISDLPIGMYFLKARTDKAYHSAKILKQ